MINNGEAKCKECGKNKILARGLCSTCYKNKRKNGDIDTKIKNNKIIIDVLNNCAFMEIYNRHHELKAITKIDIDDVEKVSKYHWSMNGKGYIFAKINGKYTRLHHFILNFKWNGDQQNTIDHINRDQLDNRKCNLRVADMTTQNRNRSIKPKIAKFISLSDCGNYKVRVYTKKKEFIYLGSYKTLEDAIAIRDKFLKENEELCYQLQE